VALGEWEESDRSPSSLLTGGRLSQFEEWATGHDVTLAAAEQQFLGASIARATSEAADGRARRRRATVGFAAAAVVASLLAVVAVLQRDQAEENAHLAQARQVILEAEKSLTLDPELSMLLALESIEAFRAAGLDPPGSAISVLREGIRTSVVTKRLPGGRFVAVNPDGTLLATHGNGDVVVRNIASGEVVATLTRPGTSPIGAFFASGDTLAVSYQGVAKPVRIWRDWHEPDGFVDVGPDGSPTPYVESVQWSPNGDLVAIDALEVWSMSAAEMNYRIPGVEPVHASFSTDGRLSILDYPEAGAPVIRKVNAATGDDLENIDLDLPFDPVWHSFSPDGERLAVADSLNLAMVDAHTGALVWHTDTLSRVGPPFWLNDGKVLLVGGEGTPAVVEAASGNLIQELPGHRGGTFSYAQVPGTSLVASAGQDDEETIIFDLGPAPFEVGGFTSSIPGIAEMGFAGVDASLWLTADRHPQSSALIDAATGDTEVYFPHQFTGVSPNGRFSAGFDAEGQSVLWSNSDQHEVLTAPDGRGVLGISDDGTLAVIGGPTTQMVSTIDGSLLAELDAGPVFEAVFSPDRRFVVTNNNGESSYPGIMIWDVSNGDLLGSLDQMSGFKSRFTPDDRKLVVGGYDGRIHIFDFEQLRAGVDEHQAVLRSIPAHENFILSLVVSPDGSMAFSRNWGDPVKLWNLATGEALGEFGIKDPDFDYPPAAAFHPTEPWLYATVGDGQIAIYTLDIDALMEMARTRLTRGFTEEECQLYLRRSCGDEA
jgi:WD40 repeat protein